MYVPKHFEETDPAILHALIAAHPLGTWVTQTDGELSANHIPFILDTQRGELGTLVGHVARASGVWTGPGMSGDSLVVFQGSDAYVSPSWYPSKNIDGKAVPTWNYAVVHAYGTPRAVEEPEALLRILTALTDRHEAGNAMPWRVADAPEGYIDRLMQAIVGIEIPITRMTGKWKVSQNRSQADRQGVTEGLRSAGDAASAAMADLVAQHGAQPRA